MSEPSNHSLSELLADRALMDAAVQRAARQVLGQHARDGRKVPISQDGKVVWVAAEELLARLDSQGGQATETRQG